MFDYVIIGCGFKRVFSAPDDRSAFFEAMRIARENSLRVWALYDRSLCLIGTNDPECE